MTNELILIFSLLFIFGSLLLFYRLFGPVGAIVFSAVATLAANIEVVALVNAFGMEMTLGNILFASTFLATDILSESHGKAEAQKAVWSGIAVSCFFALLSRSWLLYLPSSDDIALQYFEKIFTQTPRIVVVSLVVYAFVQWLDVTLYHLIWGATNKLAKGDRAFLWVRNNLGTIISQLVNSILFNFGAFWRVYPNSVVLSLIISTFVIYIATSLLDTPFLYMARRIADNKSKKGLKPGGTRQA